MTDTATNVGRWESWYAAVTEPEAYGDTVTYRLGADWLADCPLVEDWGCGKGWLRQFVPAARYRGIDGSRSPFADDVVDLATYRSSVPGIFMRHVLEHNYDWRRILRNALASFTDRMALILFSPIELAGVTREIGYDDDPGVPILSFALPDLATIIDEEPGVRFIWETLETDTAYGLETILRVQR